MKSIKIMDHIYKQKGKNTHDHLNCFRKTFEIIKHPLMTKRNRKLVIVGNLLNIIKGIYEKLKGNMLNGE